MIKQLNEIVALYHEAMPGGGRVYEANGDEVLDYADSGTGGPHVKAVGGNPVETSKLIAALLNFAEDLANEHK
jgi:hypothetical protein